MRKGIAAVNRVAFLLLTGITYGAQNEIYGGLSVSGSPAPYYYSESGGTNPGYSTQRCLCDVSDTAQDCPFPYFYSNNQGDVCADNITGGYIL